MVQRPSDLKGSLRAAIAAVNSNLQDTKAVTAMPRTAEKFAKLRATLESALHAVENDRQVDRASLTLISKWVADWIPNDDDPLLDRLDEVEQALGLP